MKFIFIFTIIAWTFTAQATPDELIQLRKETQHIVQTVRCGSCHTPGLPTTNEKALKIYNLSSPFWSATMSDRQLRDFLRRVKDKPMEPDKEKDFSANELKTVETFVQNELLFRRDHPNDRFREVQSTKYSEAYKVFGL